MYDKNRVSAHNIKKKYFNPHIGYTKICKKKKLTEERLNHSQFFVKGSMKTLSSNFYLASFDKALK